MSAKYLKYKNQSLLDFLITHHGTVDALFEFMQAVGHNNTSDFERENVRYYKLAQIPQNPVNRFFSENQKAVVSTDKDALYCGLAYGNDLTFKSIVKGSYNNDFNNDFDIDSGLQVVTVGYEGMTLTTVFSISNTGNKVCTASGTIEVDGVVKNWSVDVSPDDIVFINTDFENLQQGSYTVEIKGDYQDSKDFEVLGKAVFTCNADLNIVEAAPYFIGDTLTMRWTVTNNGTATDLYKGVSYYSGVETDKYINHNVTIQAGQTVTIERTITLSVENSSFTSSCGQTVNIEITKLQGIIYNNDLEIIEDGPYLNGQTVTVQWSLTNVGITVADAYGTIEYYPDDNLNIRGWGTTMQVGQTKTFTQQYKIYGGQREIRLQGDAVDSLTINVVSTDIYKFVFWADLNKTEPFIPQLSQEPITVPPNTGVQFHANLVNNTASTINVNVKYRWNSTYVFYENDIDISANSSYNTGYGVASNYKNITIPVELLLNDVVVGLIHYNITN